MGGDVNHGHAMKYVVINNNPWVIHVLVFVIFLPNGIGSSCEAMTHICTFLAKLIVHFILLFHVFLLFLQVHRGFSLHTVLNIIGYIFNHTYCSIILMEIHM